MDGKSLDIQQTQLEKLKELFPEAISEGKIDWEKLKATLGEDITFSNERYVLNWAGKSDAFKVLQSPTTATLTPAKEESVNFDDTGHLFIEGENLEVLKVLQKSYYGKVKMIYIDPPYNTGNDHFIYPDRFSESKEDYLKRVGEKDEEGYLTREGMYRKNSRDSGHYHSNWLNMMYPRLFLARNLLKDDGVIFVSIDDNEVHNLRLLMNEIFGEENFLANFIWMNEGNIDNQSRIKRNHEYVLLYAKNEVKIDAPPVIDPNIPKNSKLYNEFIENTIVKNGPGNPVSSIKLPVGFPTNFKEGLIEPKENFWPKLEGKVVVKNYKTTNEVTVSSGWSSKEIFTDYLKNDLNPVYDTKNQESTFYLSETGAIMVRKKRTDRQSHVLTILRNMGTVQGASRELEELGIDFSYPKPVKLIKYFAQIGDEKNGIYLDFFSGSSPLAQSVLELNQKDNNNRRFICVQLPEKTNESSKAYKAGYKTIADLAKERIRRVIKKIEKEQESEKKAKAGKLDFGDEKKVPMLDLGFKVFKFQSSNFKIWRGNKFENGEQLEKQLDAFTDPTKEGSEEENMLYELLLKSGFDLNSTVEHKGSYYVVNGNEIVVALTKMNEATVKEIVSLKPDKCIALDKLFAGNDQLKTNTVLQMRDAGVEFKTI